jgi:hypothetical protein
MKMTKQMQEDFKFLKDTKKMMVSYWGEKGFEIFSGIHQDIEAELAPLYEQSLEQVTSYVLAYFRKYNWPEEKISRWLAGKKSPFRKGLQVNDEILPQVLVAEFSLIRLGDVLLTLGLPLEAINTGAFGHSDVSRIRCWYRINTWSSVPLYLAHRSANI